MSAGLNFHYKLILSFEILTVVVRLLAIDKKLHKTYFVRAKEQYYVILTEFFIAVNVCPFSFVQGRLMRTPVATW